MGNGGWTGSWVHSISAHPKQEERAAIEAAERSKMGDRHTFKSGLIYCISKIKSIIGPLFIVQVVRGTNKALSSVYPGHPHTTANIRLNGRTVSFNVTISHNHHQTKPKCSALRASVPVLDPGCSSLPLSRPTAMMCSPRRAFPSFTSLKKPSSRCWPLARNRENAIGKNVHSGCYASSPKGQYQYPAR
jgi:hypothetical protein